MSADDRDAFPLTATSSDPRPDPDSAPTSSRGRRDGIGAVRASTLFIVVWSFAMLTAVLLAGLLHFAEVQRSCGGVSTIRFAEAIEARCRSGEATTEVAMNAAAAMVFFAVVGLVVLVLATVWYAAARHRERHRIR